MDGTIIQQGSFTNATGGPVTIQVRSGVDWIRTYNYTQTLAGAANTGLQFFWQYPMPVGSAFEYRSNGAGNAIDQTITLNGGFTPVDSSVNFVGAAVATTASTNATRPVFNTANTGTLQAGSVVRIINSVGQPNLGGYDFTVDAVTVNTNFRIANTLANAPGAVGAAGIYRIINFDPLFYPPTRTIVNITQANRGVVTTSVNHNYIVGQSVRFNITAPFGMTQLNGVLANITAVTASTFTINIDTTGFTAFTFPLAASYPFTPASVNPVGEETDQFSNPNLLDDATVNTGYIGVVLAPGGDGAAGQAGDVVYWMAGKSFNV